MRYNTKYCGLSIDDYYSCADPEIIEWTERCYRLARRVRSEAALRHENYKFLISKFPDMAGETAKIAQWTISNLGKK